MATAKKNQNVVPFKSGNGKARFTQLPHSVFAPDRQGNPPPVAILSPRAQLLLVHLLSLYNGHNNGDLALTTVTLKPYGDLYQSKRYLQDLIVELCAYGFLVRTRYGRPNLYAVTWLPISEETAHKIEPEFIRRDKNGKWITNPLRLFEPRYRDQIDAEWIARYEKRHGRHGKEIK